MEPVKISENNLLERIGDWITGRKGIRPVVVVFYSVSAVILAAMMFLTAADVILRYVFRFPVPGSLELTEYMMVIFLSGGLAYCAIQKGHVKVDVITNHLSSRAQAVLESIMGILSLGVAAIISWRSFMFIPISMGAHEQSYVWKIFTYPFFGVVGLGMALLTVVLLADLLKSIAKVIGK